MRTKTNTEHWSFAKKCWLTLVILVCCTSILLVPYPQYFFNRYVYNLLALMIMFGYIGLILNIILRRKGMTSEVYRHLSRCMIGAGIYGPLSYVLNQTPAGSLLSGMAFVFALYGYIKAQQQQPFKTRSKNLSDDG